MPKNNTTVNNNDTDDFGDFDYYDDYDYDSYGDADNYDTSGEHSLTADDDKPLTSKDAPDFLLPGEDFAAQPRGRGRGRRETIEQVAEDIENGLTRKPGVTPPDPRIATLAGNTDSANTQGRRRSAAYRRATNNNGRAPQTRSKKSTFAPFYIVLLLIAIGVCMTVLVMVFQNLRENPPDLNRPPLMAETPPAHGIAEGSRAGADLRTQTALITAINPQGGGMRTITLMDISSRQSNDFFVTDETLITDRFNRPITFPQMRVGNLVDIGYDSRTNYLATLGETRQPQAFTHRARTEVYISIEDFTVTLGRDIWNFNSQTLIMYRGEPFPVSQITPIDSVTLVGHGDTVWLIQLDSAHGFLQLLNADQIVNGVIIIGTTMRYQIEDITEDVTLSEGTHRIEISGDNIDTYITDITVSQGAVTRLNLGDIPLRNAILHISVTPYDAHIFVNGELHDNLEGPAEVEFGENIVRVERYGFYPQEQTFDITTPVFPITFVLEQITHDATITIFSLPDGARIYMNDEFIGNSTLTRRAVPPGEYTFVARLPGYQSNPSIVTITGSGDEDIMRSLLLMPIIDDPFANISPHPVEPIPTETPAPGLPTIPPLPLPPGYQPQPTPQDGDEPPPGGGLFPEFPELPNVFEPNPPWWGND